MHPSPPLSPTHRRWPLTLLALALIALLAWGIVRALDKRQRESQAAQAAAQSLQATPVYTLAERDVVAVQRRTLEQTAPVSGSLQALQTVSIKARVAGELRDFVKREGDPVRAGEVVGRIDPADAQARVRQAEQQAAAALAQRSIAQRTLSNNQALVQQGFISATALQTSQASLDAADANHQAALAALDIARKGLADTVLRSPIAGQVSARPAHSGERVGVDARVLDVVDLSAFEMEAALSPADAARVQVNQPARLRVEGLDEPVAAQVVRINPSVQPGSRSVLVYLRLQARPGMRQGLFAQGEIVTGTLQALAVAASAVRNDQPQAYVQVLREGLVRHVALPEGAPRGLANGEPLQAVPMLAEGDAVLAATAGALREGTRVQRALP